MGSASLASSIETLMFSIYGGKGQRCYLRFKGGECYLEEQTVQLMLDQEPVALIVSVRTKRCTVER